MSRRQRVGDLDAEPKHVRQGKRTAAEPLCERLAIQQFEDEIIDVALASDVVEAADVRMVQCGNGPGLASEPGARPASRASVGASTFSATARSSRVSRARYTSPIPPAPISETTS
jgi:hypothetical protein